MNTMSVRLNREVASTGCRGRPCAYAIQMRMGNDSLTNYFVVTNKRLEQIDPEGRMMEATAMHCTGLVRIARDEDLMNYTMVYTYKPTTEMWNTDAEASYMGMNVVPHGHTMRRWIEAVQEWQGGKGSVYAMRTKY